MSKRKNDSSSLLDKKKSKNEEILKKNNNNNNKNEDNEESEDEIIDESEKEDNKNDSTDEEDEIYDPALKKFVYKKKNFVNEGEILVILDIASLEIVKTKKNDYQLLNCDDHINLIYRFKKNPTDYRPDIIHQELMTVLDSPLNKAGKIKVLVKTEKNVLFEVNPKTRIPRTFKRFSGLMVQLLHKNKIKSSDNKEVLLKVVKNPISRHLPAGAKCIGFSHAGRLVSPEDLVETLPLDKPEVPIVLVFGAQATKGIVPEEHPYLEDLCAISSYPLSGVVAINRVMGAIEKKLNIL